MAAPTVILSFSSFLLLAVGQCEAIRPYVLEPSPAQRDNFVVLDFRSVPLKFSNFSYSGVTNITKRKYDAFVAVLPTDISANFSFALPKGGQYYFFFLVAELIIKLDKPCTCYSPTP